MGNEFLYVAYRRYFVCLSRIVLSRYIYLPVVRFPASFIVNTTTVISDADSTGLAAVDVVMPSTTALDVTTCRLGAGAAQNPLTLVYFVTESTMFAGMLPL